MTITDEMVERLKTALRQRGVDLWGIPDDAFRAALEAAIPPPLAQPERPR
jgi:hypothetical protein